MAKSTKQSSSERGETSVKPSGKKAASSKTGVKKSSTKSTVKGKDASTKNAGAKKQPLAKKTVARKATSKKKAAPKKAAPKNGATPKNKAAADAAIRRQITPAERHQMIAEAAYLRAESHGFLGDDRDDWLHAEAGIDSMLTRVGVIVAD